MGTSYHIAWAGSEHDREALQQQVDARLVAINRSMSTYDPKSELSRLNRGLLPAGADGWVRRSEEHTSELQSRPHLVCRLLIEKKFGNAQGFIREDALDLAFDILHGLRENLPRDTLILIDVHPRFTESESIRVALRTVPLSIYC